MSDGSKIEWTDATWTVTRGCSRVSRGCGDGAGGGCYAERMAHRFSGPGGAFEGLTRLTPGGPRWTGKLELAPEALDLPLRWRKPRRVFVDSMSDLFHEAVPESFIEAVFGVMSLAGRHTFQLLTKRADRMRAFLERATLAQCQAAAVIAGVEIHSEQRRRQRADARVINGPWPLPNVWLGVSVEDQRAADERIPHLLATPAAVRFLSCEPLLGPVDLMPGLYRQRAGDPWLDWVIAGSESGPKARPMDEGWVRSLRDRCVAARVAFFYKQRLEGRRVVSTPELDGRTWKEFPRG